MLFRCYPFIIYILFVVSFLTSILKAGTIDVLHYDIKLDLIQSLSNQNAFYTGNVSITFRVDTTEINVLTFNSLGLGIDTVVMDNKNLSYDVSRNFLTIALSRKYLLGEECTILIYYNHPDTTSSYFFGGYQVILKDSLTPQLGAYTYGIPGYARQWFPCKDVPYDKATSDINIKVPSGYVVTSNGSLEEENQLQNHTIFHWKERYPIWTSTIFIAISKYSVYKNNFSVGGKNIDIGLYVWAIDGKINFNPQEVYNKTIDIINFYSSVYSTYPFDNIKFVFTKFGILSNQSVIQLSDQDLKSFTENADNVIPHEIAHQWFGDFISANSLGELWLNEGFAHYSWALYKGYKFGGNKLRQTLSSYALRVLENDIRLVNSGYLYHQTIYNKGACVIDMLNYCLGDSLFWNIIHSLIQRYSYSSISSSDLLSIVNEMSGLDYSWFFNQWIFSAGYPVYNIYWQSNSINDNEYEVKINIKQVQDSIECFKMPLPFKIVSENHDTTVTFFNDQREQEFVFQYDKKPVNIVFDENNHIMIKRIDTIITEIKSVGIPFDFILNPNFPNPFNPQTTISYEIPTASFVELKIFDILGKEVSTLVKEEKSAGRYEVNFIANNLSSGIYLYRLKSGTNIKIKKMVLLR